jgi:hypothetical protein
VVARAFHPAVRPKAGRRGQLRPTQWRPVNSYSWLQTCVPPYVERPRVLRTSRSPLTGWYVGAGGPRARPVP